MSKVREGLAKYLAEALSGTVSTDEIGTLVTDACKKAGKSLPIGKLNPKNVTKDELDDFLKQVSTKGGKSPEERNGLRMTIVRHGSTLAEQAKERKAAKAAQANGSTKPQLAHA